MRVLTLQMANEMLIRGSVSITIRVKEMHCFLAEHRAYGKEPYDFCITLTLPVLVLSPALEARLGFQASGCPPTLPGKSRRKHFPWD